MKRMIIFLVLICLFTMGCKNDIVIENSSSQEVSSEERPIGYEYILNTSTLKYHAQFCPLVGNIKDENRKTTTDIDFFIERGYLPCGSCIAR